MNTVNDLSSNHLPIILEFKNTNIIKKVNMTTKTDWDKYLNKTDIWKIRHNFKINNEIDSCIKDLQKFLHKALKDSFTRHFYNKYNLTVDLDTIADLNKLIKLRNFLRRKFQHTKAKNIEYIKMCLVISNKIASNRNKNWDDKFKIAKTKDNSLWRILKSVQENTYHLRRLYCRTSL